MRVHQPLAVAPCELAQQLHHARCAPINPTPLSSLPVRQACMRPCPPDALPFMGAVPGLDGAYISAGGSAPPRTPSLPTRGMVSYTLAVYACLQHVHAWATSLPSTPVDAHVPLASTGHNCWGILWAPVSGKAMSELLIDGKASCVDLRAFDPARFVPTQRNRGRKRGDQPVGEQW